MNIKRRMIIDCFLTVSVEWKKSNGKLHVLSTCSHGKYWHKSLSADSIKENLDECPSTYELSKHQSQHARFTQKKLVLLHACPRAPIHVFIRRIGTNGTPFKTRMSSCWLPSNLAVCIHIRHIISNNHIGIFPRPDFVIRNILK